jgi:hypothetical protein
MFYNAAEQHAMTADCLACFARSEETALSLFERIDAGAGDALDREESPKTMHT